MEAGGSLSHSHLLRQIDHLLSGAELREMLDWLREAGLVITTCTEGSVPHRPITYHHLIVPGDL